MTTSLRERILAKEAQGDLLAKVTKPKYGADPSFQRAPRARLADLNAKYQDACLALNGKVRRGVSDDQRKGKLSQEPRLLRLQKFATVDMKPAQQFRDFEIACSGFSAIRARISKWWSSASRIEGVTAPLGRIRALVQRGAAPRGRSEQEVAGYRDALCAPERIESAGWKSLPGYGLKPRNRR